jgi:23S rRNA U2552 (ribose-2'-O)-methylase RlmE/FtsJ
MNSINSNIEGVILKCCNIVPIYKEEINCNEKILGYDNIYTEVKNKIDTVNINIWNRIRRYTNNYEFPLKRSGYVSPISRAFFKMWEMIHDYKLIKKDEKIIVLSIAEAPGGFIQAIYNFMEVPYRIYTMSLMSSDEYIPRYSARLYNDKMMNILYGVNGDGDIYNKDNIESIRSSMGSKAELITGDGGFNENNRYNIKEQLHNKLFLSEIIIAISNQKYEGKFVMKFFDTYTRFSLDLIYILLFFYKNVEMTKPLTSRPTNSEKYIICSGFKKLTNQHRKITNKLKEILPSVNELTFRILDISIPSGIINKVRDNNIIFMKSQIESINKNINIISNITKDRIDKFPHIERNNDRKKWLIKYNLDG